MNEAVISCCEAFNNIYQIRMVFPLLKTQSVRGISRRPSLAGLASPRNHRREAGGHWRALDGAGWNVLYLISCQLRLIHSRSIDI